jgi:cell division protein FtsW (lipid II flippase)
LTASALFSVQLAAAEGLQTQDLGLDEIRFCELLNDSDLRYINHRHSGVWFVWPRNCLSWEAQSTIWVTVSCMFCVVVCLLVLGKSDHLARIWVSLVCLFVAPYDHYNIAAIIVFCRRLSACYADKERLSFATVAGIASSSHASTTNYIVTVGLLLLQKVFGFSVTFAWFVAFHE